MKWNMIRVSRRRVVWSIVIMIGFGIALALQSLHPVRWAELMIFGVAMLLIAEIDNREKIIPNCILCLLAGVHAAGILITMICDRNQGVKMAVQAGTGFAFMLVVFGIIRLIFGRKIGMGDVKLMIVVGFFAGIETGCWILMTALLAAVVRFIPAGKKKKQTAISFGPCVAAGSLIVFSMGALGTLASYVG